MYQFAPHSTNGEGKRLAQQFSVFRSLMLSGELSAASKLVQRYLLDALSTAVPQICDSQHCNTAASPNCLTSLLSSIYEYIQKHDGLGLDSSSSTTGIQQ